MFVFFFKFLVSFVISLARLTGATMPALWHWINEARTTAPVVSDAEFKIILDDAVDNVIHNHYRTTSITTVVSTFHLAEVDECLEPEIRQGARAGLRGSFEKGWYQDRSQRRSHAHKVSLVDEGFDAVHHTFWGVYPHRDVTYWIGLGLQVEVRDTYHQKRSPHQPKNRLKMVDMTAVPNDWTATAMADDILKREQEEAMWESHVVLNTMAQLRYAFRFPASQEDMDMWPDMYRPAAPVKDVWWMIEQDRLCTEMRLTPCGCGKALMGHANMCYECYVGQYSVVFADAVWTSLDLDKMPCIHCGSNACSCEEDMAINNHECLLQDAQRCRFCGLDACDCEDVDVDSLIF